MERNDEIEHRIAPTRDRLDLTRAGREDHTPTPIDLFWQERAGGGVNPEENPGGYDSSD